MKSRLALALLILAAPACLARDVTPLNGPMPQFSIGSGNVQVCGPSASGGMTCTPLGGTITSGQILPYGGSGTGRMIDNDPWDRETASAACFRHAHKPTSAGYYEFDADFAALCGRLVMLNATLSKVYTNDEVDKSFIGWFVADQERRQVGDAAKRQQ